MYILGILPLSWSFFLHIKGFLDCTYQIEPVTDVVILKKLFRQKIGGNMGDFLLQSMLFRLKKWP
jgi:hypothetical protein